MWCRMDSMHRRMNNYVKCLGFARNKCIVKVLHSLTFYFSSGDGVLLICCYSRMVFKETVNTWRDCLEEIKLSLLWYVFLSVFCNSCQTFDPCASCDIFWVFCQIKTTLVAAIHVYLVCEHDRDFFSSEFNAWWKGSARFIKGFLSLLPWIIFCVWAQAESSIFSQWMGLLPHNDSWFFFFILAMVLTKTLDKILIT